MRSFRYVALLVTGASLLYSGCEKAATAPPRSTSPRVKKLAEHRELAELVTLNPKGAFVIGGMDGEPRREVSIAAFAISPTEVTRDLYRAVVGEDPSVSDRPGDHPVQNLSWTDAVKFCNALSTKLGLKPAYDGGRNYVRDRTANGYRLPTRAEWEYACRGHGSTLYFWGDQPSQVYCVAPKGSRKGRGGLASDPANEGETPPFAMTNSVASVRPNVHQLFDMAGNVAEWCDDGPADRREMRFAKGGSWADFDWQAMRTRKSKLLSRDERLPTIGLRLAKSIP